MEVYTSGISKKFFKEYLSYMQSIDDNSVRKCRETIQQLQIPTTDEYGREKAKPGRPKKSVGQ